MTALEPNVAETGRYSIEEAAAALGMHRNTLRRLTKASKIKCGFRRHNMRRFYLGSEIKRFWKSYY